MILNIAHRGARSLAPENTLLSARKGFDSGADLWETDVALTGDGEPILLHDADLRRTTDVEVRFPARSIDPVTRFTLAEVRCLDAGSWFLETDPFGQISAGALSPGDLNDCRGEPVPTLEEALVLTRDLNWRVNLELKAQLEPMGRYPMVERVIRIVDRVGIQQDQVVISSFYHPWLQEVKARRRGFDVQALIGDDNDHSLDWGDGSYATYNVLWTLISEDVIREKTRQGVSINLFTVNDEENFRRFRNAGARGLITDFPQRLAAFIRTIAKGSGL
ncbi:MAG: glycerophosphodiester phosphodiesterase family protein [Desulfobacterales bacterium]|jgi:glycerophosphoryl diester phosphodiesterase